MAITKEELIREYSKAVKEGNAAIFGGAGLSRPSGFVDWKDLLRPLAKDIKLDIDKESDLLSVAQYYRNHRKTRNGINQAIIDAFSKDVSTNENVSIITRIPIFTYWTTNYDHLIENGIREANRNPDVKSESEQLPVIKHGRDAIVYKMHGDVNNPAKAVLTKEDYELYEYKRPLFRSVLRSDLLSKKFLFIGFSFEDPNLDYVLSQIHGLLGDNVLDHYCFVKRVKEEDYKDKSEYDYDKGKQDMQEENLRHYGIQAVFVDSYDEITDILHEIEKASKMKNVFISGSAEEFTGVWSKIQAENFASNLAGALVREDCRITTGFGLGIGSSVVNGALDVIYSEKFRHVDQYLCLRPFPQNIADSNDRSRRWKQYREDMLSETGVSIFIFGNKKDRTSGDIVEADGCIQEFEIAKEKGNVIIPIGSTGYAAKTIFNMVRADCANYSYLNSFLDLLESETDIDKLIEAIKAIIKNQQY